MPYLRADELQPGDVWRHSGNGGRNDRALRFLDADRGPGPGILVIRAEDTDTGDLEVIEFPRADMVPVIEDYDDEGDDDDC